VLTMNAGATAPEWAAGGGGGGGITIGTTTITSGTNTRVLYNNAGVVGEYGVTGTAGNAVLSDSPTITTPAITTSQTTTRNSIGVTSTDGIVLQNTTAATAGNQQYSPRLRLKGSGWKTNATAAAQDVEYWLDARPVQGTSAPTSLLSFNVQTNGSGGEPIFVINDTGTNDGADFYFGRAWGSGNLDIYNSLTAGINGWNFKFNGSGVFGTGQGSQFQVTVPISFVASIGGAQDTYLRKNAAAHLTFGTTDAASPVAQTLSVQNVVAGTSNTAGATWTHRASLQTGNAVPGRFHVTGGALSETSGTTQATAVDRLITGAAKVLTNNSATTILNVTNASNTNAGGVLDYCVEVFDATDVQYECGMVTYGISNKGGVFSGNTATKFGNHQNATSGTLTVTFAISAANPGALSVNANSSLIPSTGYPRITYSLRNLTQQAVAVQ